MAVYQLCTDSLTIFTAQSTVSLTRSVLNHLTGLWVPLRASVCVSAYVCMAFFVLPFFLFFCLPALHHQLPDCSGSLKIVPLVFLLSPYLRLHRVQSCSEAAWITTHSCSPVSCSVPGSLTLVTIYAHLQGLP